MKVLDTPCVPSIMGLEAHQNIMTMLSEEAVNKIASIVKEGYTTDSTDARFRDWCKEMEDALALVQQKAKPKSTPWPDAANIVFPLMSTAALQFHARVYGALTRGDNYVNVRGTHSEIARAVKTLMNSMLQEPVVDFEGVHDRLLYVLPVMGSAFVKVVPGDPTPVEELVLATDLVMDFGASSVYTCPRKTQVMHKFSSWMKTQADAGLMVPWNSHDPEKGPSLEKLLEQHLLLDLDCDGVDEPYIATLHEKSGQLLRLVAGWDNVNQVKLQLVDGQLKVLQIKPTTYYAEFIFIPSPTQCPYGMGFAQLLKGINMSVNALINQLLDAGSLSNSATGFIGRGANIPSGQVALKPFSFIRFNGTVEDLQKAIYQLKFEGPSTVLYQLLTTLIEFANRLSSTADSSSGELPGQNTPATTSLTALEQGMKVFNAAFRRVWRGLRREYLMLTEAMRLSGPPEIQVVLGAFVGKVLPSSDFSFASDIERKMQAETLRAAAGSTPGYNRGKVELRYLEALGIPDIDEIFNAEESGVSEDPKIALQREELKLKADELALERARFEHEKQVQQAELANAAMKLEVDKLLVAGKVRLMDAETSTTASDQAVSEINAATGLARSGVPAAGIDNLAYSQPQPQPQPAQV